MKGDRSVWHSLVAACCLLIATILPVVNGEPVSRLTRRWGMHQLHEERYGGSSTWTKHSRAEQHQMIPLRIGLKQRNLEHADRFIYEVSDPESSSYAKHWTADQVAKTFAPAKHSEDQVIEWLKSHGIEHTRIRPSKNRHWVEANVTIAEAEWLFQTEYHIFHEKSAKSRELRLACDTYSLPQTMKQHIDLVLPTIHIHSRRMTTTKNKRRSLSPDLPNGLTGVKHCKELITIECMRAIYNFGKANHSAASNKMGIVEESNYLVDSDLTSFFENYTNPKIPSDVRPEFLSIDGGKTFAEMNNTIKVVESNLDFQIAYSIIYPQQLRLYQVGDGVNVSGEGTFNIVLDALDASYCTYKGGDQPHLDPHYPDPDEGGYAGPLQCGGAPKSNVISFSYTQIEAQLPRFYQERQCHEWMKLALQGVSVLFGSGDAGVANSEGTSGDEIECVNAENGHLEVNGTQFAPSFPANCPYITSVGWTQLKTSSIYGGEIAAQSTGTEAVYGSGGGFSNVFSRPAYQDGAVTSYLQNHAPDYGANVYNRSGRGIPDVSALGMNITVVVLGETMRDGGSSASAPLFASIVNLINEERIHAGMKPIGFLNPTLYKHPEMFSDVTGGSNPGCGTKGFTAVKGWDPVTGMGTPNYEKMKEVFMKLPSGYE